MNCLRPSPSSILHSSEIDGQLTIDLTVLSLKIPRNSTPSDNLALPPLPRSMQVRYGLAPIPR
ncbi:hypothetical protein BJX96DRAFT_47068 [Aspergillus floccosus]